MRPAGFVLAGGNSSRMGRDKALLEWDSHPLIERIAREVEAVTGNIALIGVPDRYTALGIECFPDLRPGLGPLAGIEAALMSGRGDLNLIVACDMPLLESAWLRDLLHTANQTNARCVVSLDSTGNLHPLCAVYRTDCLPVVQHALDENRLKLRDLVRELDAVTVEIGRPILNVNTPQDWDLFLSTLRH
jgi:molybdopterin-guanine dinucleotide biosynthesis protein A